jgi:hypothetical protein
MNAGALKVLDTLSSLSFVKQALASSKEATIKHRRELADEIRRLKDAQGATIADAARRTSILLADVQAAREVLTNAEFALAMHTRGQMADSLISAARIGALEQELVRDADPLIDQSIAWLDEHFERYRHRLVEARSTGKETPLIGRPVRVMSSNARAAADWAERVQQVREDMEVLKLDSDQSDMEARLDRLREQIPSPTALAFEEVRIHPAAFVRDSRKEPVE